MKPLSKSYIHLLSRYPLKPIKNERELEAASEVVDSLAEHLHELTPEESDYLDVLTDLIETFESKEYPVGPAVTPVEALKYLMGVNNLNNAEIARILGIQRSRITEFLQGMRNLTVEQIARLSTHFAVSTDLFVPKVVALPIRKRKPAIRQPG